MFLILLIAGCVSHSQNIPEEENPAREHGRKIVAAVIAGDYERFMQDSGEKSRNPEQDAQDFKNSCKQLSEQFGTAESFRFLGELQTPLLTNQIYAVRFIKKSKGSRDAITHEQIFQLILGEENGSPKLLGMRFI